LNIVYLAPFAFSPKATVSARMLPMAAALVQRGHAVTILIPPYDNLGDSGKVWAHERVKLENMIVRQRTSDVRRQLSLARQLAKRTRQLKPDLIHVFKPIGPGALAMWLLKQSSITNHQSQIPTLVDNDDWEGRGGWLDVNPYPALQKRVLAWQERWALQHADAITAASDVLVLRSQELIEPQQKPILLLPNGPDEALHNQVAQAESKRDSLRTQFGWANKQVVIYAGTVPNGHDMDMAVQAIRSNLTEGRTRRLESLRGLERRLHFVIIATGDGLPSLRAAIEQADIGEHVEWHGYMPHAQLIERLVAADVAIYPYRDTNINRAKCSGKVIDYMACAKPIVVSDVGMNRRYLQHEVSGLLTLPGDSAAFSAALGQLLAHPHEAQRMGHAAQQRLWQQFGWGARVRTLEHLYEEERQKLWAKRM
jgi:glycosyltransferase involved in cell wall biosynthesis